METAPISMPRPLMMSGTSAARVELASAPINRVTAISPPREALATKER